MRILTKIIILLIVSLVIIGGTLINLATYKNVQIEVNQAITKLTQSTIAEVKLVEKIQQLSSNTKCLKKRS